MAVKVNFIVAKANPNLYAAAKSANLPQEQVSQLEQFSWTVDKNKKLNIPIQILWGKSGVIGKQFNSIKIWKRYSNKKVYGHEINSGHFIPEQNPKQVIFKLKNFFLKQI